MKIGPYRTLDPFPELSYNELIMREAIFRKARQFCKSHVSYKIKAAENQRLTRIVELRGVEPLSKHNRQRLSTCLSRHCLSGGGRGRTNQPPP